MEDIEPGFCHGKKYINNILIIATFYLTIKALFLAILNAKLHDKCIIIFQLNFEFTFKNTELTYCNFDFV